MIDWNDYENFSQFEFTCKCCGIEEMNAAFMDRLQDIRTELGFPFKITSGYRCPNHNDNVSSTGRIGPHTTGRALDIAVAGAKSLTLLVTAVAFGFTGVGSKQRGDHDGRFIHLDDLLDHETAGPRPWHWTY